MLPTGGEGKQRIEMECVKTAFRVENVKGQECQGSTISLDD